MIRSVYRESWRRAKRATPVRSPTGAHLVKIINNDCFYKPREAILDNILTGIPALFEYVAYRSFRAAKCPDEIIGRSTRLSLTFGRQKCCSLTASLTLNFKHMCIYIKSLHFACLFIGYNFEKNMVLAFKL